MKQTTLVRALLLVLIAFSLTSCGSKKQAEAADTKKDKDEKASSTQTTDEATAPGGPEINAKDEKFSVTMPKGFDSPKRSVEPLVTDAGKITMVSYLSSNERGACMVMYGAYPESLFDQKSTTKMLDDARDSAKAKMNATLEKQEDFTVDGNPARSCYYSAKSEGTELHSRFDYILVKPALYQVAFVGMTKDEVTKPDIQGYFKSFKLMK